MKSQRNKFVSTISAILLSCVIMMLTVSFAFAAEITALTESNIAVWPTFEGEMFYGQKLNEGNLQIVGGVVTLDGTADGTVVEGHFEFSDPEYRPTQITGNYASMTFIPDDKDSYAGFTVSENENAVYEISKTDPVLQDPVNDPPVATQIAAGKRVMNSTLSGGTLMNPYTKEVIAEGKWAWAASSRTKVVNESAYYQAGSHSAHRKTIIIPLPCMFMSELQAIQLKKKCLQRLRKSRQLQRQNLWLVMLGHPLPLPAVK